MCLYNSEVNSVTFYFENDNFVHDTKECVQKQQFNNQRRFDQSKKLYSNVRPYSFGKHEPY